MRDAAVAVAEAAIIIAARRPPPTASRRSPRGRRGPRARGAWRCPAADTPGRRRAAPAPRPERRFALALHHQPRKADMADDDALLLGYERQHHVAVAAQARRRESASPKPGKHASSRSRICGSSPGISRRNTTMPLQPSDFATTNLSEGLLIHVKVKLRAAESMVFGNARRGQPSARSAEHGAGAKARPAHEFRRPRRASCRRAAAPSMRTAPSPQATTSGSRLRIVPGFAGSFGGAAPRAPSRAPCRREAPNSVQAPGKGDSPRMRLQDFRGRQRPVDAGLRLVDLRRIGDAGLALRRADERAALQRRRRPAPSGRRRALPGGRAGFPPCPPARSARARRGRPGRCRALPPCA